MTEEQSVTSPRGGALGRNFHERHSNCNRKILHCFLNWDAWSGRLILFQVKPICSMVGIILEFFIKTISYCYWMRLSIISYGRDINTSYEKYYAPKIYGTGYWYSKVYEGTISYEDFPCEAFQSVTPIFTVVISFSCMECNIVDDAR